MKEEKPINKLGCYQILKKIATGGMGEIFLAYDPVCSRKIAIKKIKENLIDNQSIRKRFFKEAKIASRLTHPSILPIYSIHQEDENPYYTMPYIEGKTLKQLLIEAKNRQDQGLVLLPEHSLHSTIRIFLTVCEAIAYVHTKNILHRDLKPENILTGKYGEVLILDWGIATRIKKNDEEEELSSDEIDYNLTLPGKIAGTISHLAPERVNNYPSSFQTEVYSLGVILYQILTLSLPFKRKHITELKKNINNEQLKEPIESSIYQEIPYELNEITKKCLCVSLEERYQNVDELIQDIKEYVEGRPKWVFLHHLDIHNKNDWDFQENIFLAKHVAITHHPELAQWMTMMVSKNTYPGNMRLEVSVTFKKNHHGIGFMLCLPHIKALEEGYCFWLSSIKASSKLMRSFINIKDLSFLSLRPNKRYAICIEKIDQHLYLYIDNKYVFSFNNNLPIAGQKIGLLFKDHNFSIDKLSVHTNTTNLTLNCLTIPDSFYQKKLFDYAIEEYRKIALSFPGRTEQREAYFRCGLTILEKAKETKKKRERKKLFNEALDEFSKLHKTFYEPLEYLGKSITYNVMGKFLDESKCLELACRKFAKHPLKDVLYEHIIYRCHQSSLEHRLSAYHLIWIALRFLPKFINHVDTKKMLENLINHWEILPFLPEHSLVFFDKNHLLLELAYRLEKKLSLIEMIFSQAKEKKSSLLFFEIFILIQLKAKKETKKILLSPLIEPLLSPKEKQLLNICLLAQHDLKQAIDIFLAMKNSTLCDKQKAIIFYLLETAIATKKINEGLFLYQQFAHRYLSHKKHIFFVRYHLHLLLLGNEKEKVKNILDRYPITSLQNENFPLHYLYGCYLIMDHKQSKIDKHFLKTLDKPYPFSPSFLSYYLSKKIAQTKKDSWTRHAFSWEKKELSSQLSLLHHCQKNNCSS